MARHGACEDELEATGVLLAVRSAHRDQQPVERGGDRQHTADPPGRVAGDGGNVMGLAVKEPQPLVGGEAIGKGDPVRGGRVGAAIPRGLDVGIDGEQVGEPDRPDPRIQE